MVDTVAISRRVLVLEDDSITRTLLQAVVESFGFETAGAPTAAKGMKLLRSFDPDVAILDVDLGEGPSGVDFAVALSKLHPEVAIVFLTGLPDWELPHSEWDTFPRRPGFINKLELSDSGAILATLEASLRPSGTLKPKVAQNSTVALSRIQKEVLYLVAGGMNNQAISDHRGTSVRATRKLLQTIQQQHPQLLLDSKYTRADSAQDFLREL
tara:strand:- start:1162 stop:1797 length:636 start_codon:yes stop_codon:yes gene_type:complete